MPSLAANAEPSGGNANLKTTLGFLFKKASKHEGVALLSVALPGRYASKEFKKCTHNISSRSRSRPSTL